MTAQISLPASRQTPVHVGNLSMSFGREQALKDLSLNVPQGAIYGLVGPNGAGKTTLIKLLLNILRPSSGHANVLGLPSTAIAGDAFTRIAYVSENQELPEWMTVKQLLAYLRPFYPHWDSALEQQLIAQFDVPMNRKLKHLSRGQRMKAALLSVLAYHPALIILDEPFSGLDPLVRDELVEGLLDRATDGEPPTILISSHDLAEIETLATHIGFIDRGRLLFSEEIVALTSRFRDVTVTLHRTPQTPIIPSQNAVIPPQNAVIPSEVEGPASSPATSTPTYPSSWLLPEFGPSVLRFIHSNADSQPVEDQIAAAIPNAEAVSLEPMSLRAIFVALAKSTRSQTNADRSRA